MRGKTYCRGCNSEELFQALDLGFSPLANRVLASDRLEMEEPHYPLVLRVCRSCSLGQLGEFANSEDIFRDYSYLSSTSSFWLEQNRVFAEGIEQTLGLGSQDLILEIASNDGYLLKHWAEKGYKVLGIEPALNVATMAAWAGVPTSPEFFGSRLAQELKVMGAVPRLVVAKNVVAHVPDLQDFLNGLGIIASDRTLIIVEAPTIDQILLKKQFDTVYHEHFSYLSIEFFLRRLPDFGLNLVGIEMLSSHGGSTRFFITKVGSEDLVPPKYVNQLESSRMQHKLQFHLEENRWASLRTWLGAYKTRLREWLLSQSGPVVGYGAAAKAVTLLASSEIPRKTVPYIIDNAITKQNKHLPGHHSEIISEQAFSEMSWDAAPIFLIFPWNIGGEIANRIRRLAPSARVFVPLPEITEI